MSPSLPHDDQDKPEDGLVCLAAEYRDLVYSVARRRVRDAELAEDVTQAVFIILSRKKARLHTSTNLVGWLFKTTRFTANNALRAGYRRRVHERKAAEMRGENPEADVWDGIRDYLDQAVESLGRKDRLAILLRYYHHKSLADIAQILGLSEEAARKRINRAVEKLRGFFEAQGVESPVAILDAALLAHAIAAAPALPATPSGVASIMAKASGFWPVMAIVKLAAIGSVLSVVAVVVVMKTRGAGQSITRNTPPAQNVVPRTPPTTMASPHWKRDFPGGSVQLIAVGAGSIEKKWYSPDGTPLSRLPVRADVWVGDPPGPGLRKYWMVLESFGDPSGFIFVNIPGPQFGPEQQMLWTQTSLHHPLRPGEKNICTFVFDLPASMKQVEVDVALSAAPWRFAASAAVGDKPTTLKLPEKIGGTVTFGVPTDIAPDKCAVTFLIKSKEFTNGREHRYLAISGDKQFNGANIPGRGADSVFWDRDEIQFNCAAAAVQGLAMQVRDFAYKPMRHVELPPAN